MTLANQLRSLGLTRENWRAISPRHAAIRDDLPALLLRLFRDQGCADSRVPAPAELLSPDGTQAGYRIDLIEDLCICSDWPSSDPAAVLPPGETTAILHRAVRSCRATTVLDLGCGSGTLGLLLARSGRPVVATDINPRATALADRNAAWNGISGLEVRTGSLFQPVAGERFDLIVCQPPYLPHPPNEAAHTFLHGGVRGDELARLIIDQAVHYLHPGGRLVMFSDWPLLPDESITDRVAVAGYRGDLRCSVPVSAASYCEQYQLPGLREHLAALGVSAVQQCLAILEAGGGARSADVQVTDVQVTEVLPHQWSEQSLSY